MPLEFFPHHASLSRDHRLDLERCLKADHATTAVCTSTLELGIDIGEIACVAQIGPPFSVASLRQRLGRSGRRANQPAVLRMYAVERDPDAEAHPLDRLHLGLLRSIAMVELLIENWCEPPVNGGENPDQGAEQNQTTGGERLRCIEGLRGAVWRSASGNAARA